MTAPAPRLAATTTNAVRPASKLAVRCARISESTAFAVASFTLIIANAVVLGVETYKGTAREWHTELYVVEHLFLAAFTVELLIRVFAYGNRPGAFLREGWNVFDLIVVVAAFLPVVRENATILRLLRLARVLRAVRMFPQVRIILTAAWKSLPGALSFLVVGALVLYVYAMLGWMLFGDVMPEHYGSIGRAGLTLFLLMALDGLGDMVREGLEVSRWTALYFGSYVLLSSFLLVNLLIGVVITSLEEARQAEAPAGEAGRDAAGATGAASPSGAETVGATPEAPGPAPPAAAPCPDSDPDADLRRRIAELREALDALESRMDHR